MDIIDNFDL